MKESFIASQSENDPLENECIKYYLVLNPRQNMLLKQKVTCNGKHDRGYILF